jgi:hypothetical protein
MNTGTLKHRSTVGSKLNKEQEFGSPATSVSDVVDLQKHDLANPLFRSHGRDVLERTGCLLLEGFLTPRAVQSVCQEAALNQHLAYYCLQEHNVYLTPGDEDYSTDHPRNRNVTSSKGCITDDQVPRDSVLRTLYDSTEFRDFLCAVLGEDAMYEYADPLSSINIHYASEGQELGWHFDNSSFAITLLLQKPEGGGDFQYIRGLRYTSDGEVNFDGVRNVLDGEREVQNLEIEPGTLVLFRGGESIHRVTPVEGDQTRILAVLAYNASPNIALSESARMTFYGRLGDDL